MDPSWGACAPAGCLSTGLFGGVTEGCASGSVSDFASFVTALGSGIGDTSLYFLLLGWNSALDMVASAIWSIQSIMFAFNLQACKVRQGARAHARPVPVLLYELRYEALGHLLGVARLGQ
jgi:hypothetical protein